MSGTLVPSAAGCNCRRGWQHAPCAGPIPLLLPSPFLPCPQRPRPPPPPTSSTPPCPTCSSLLTSSTVVGLASSNTQSVMLLLVRGTRMARPFSLPFSSGKMRAMAVALPVLVGARLTRPDLQQGRVGVGGGAGSPSFSLS